MKRTDAQLISRFIRMFPCDAARIAKPCGKLFLIIGWKRHTKNWDKAVHGQWYRDGEPIEFAYFEERVVAHGDDRKKLIKSALEYKRFLATENKNE